MSEVIRLHDVAAPSVIGRSNANDCIDWKGVMHFQCFDKNGNLKWEEHTRNLITTEGKNFALNLLFKYGSTALKVPYVSLFKNDATLSAAHVATDLGESGSALFEIAGSGSDVDEATRDTFDAAAASSGSTNNTASKATFTFAGSATIYGAVIIAGNASYQIATGATLIAETKFASARSVLDDDVLQVAYTVSLS